MNFNSLYYRYQSFYSEVNPLKETPSTQWLGSFADVDRSQRNNGRETVVHHSPLPLQISIFSEAVALLLLLLPGLVYRVSICTVEIELLECD